LACAYKLNVLEGILPFVASSLQTLSQTVGKLGVNALYQMSLTNLGSQKLLVIRRNVRASQEPDSWNRRSSLKFQAADEMADVDRAFRGLATKEASLHVMSFPFLARSCRSNTWGAANYFDLHVLEFGFLTGVKTSEAFLQ